MPDPVDAVVKAPGYAGASSRTHARSRSALASTLAPLALVVAIGALLVLPRLGSQSLWIDELLTVGPALDATDLGDLIARVRTVDTQPPGSHLVWFALRDALPRGELWLRMPSFVAIELGLLVLYVALARLFGPQAALATVAIAQISPFLCFYAAEARNYALWFLVLATSIAVAVRWHESASTGRGRLWRWTVALAVVNAAGLWTHLFHAFAIVAELAVLTVPVAVGGARWRSPRRALLALAGAQVLTAALFAPWALVMLHAARTGAVGVPWTRPFSLASIGYYAFAAHFGSSFGPSLRVLHVATIGELLRRYPIALALAGGAIAVTLATWGILVRDAVRDARRRWELLPLVVWPLATIAGPLAYAARTHFPLHPRHLMLVWPLVPLVLALGILRHPRWRLPLAAAVALQVLALGNLLYDPTYAKDDERGAVAFAEQHSTGVAYVLGDVAPYYATKTRGRVKNFRDFAPDATDVWLVDNRTWEEPNRLHRRALAVQMRALGLAYVGGTARYHGIVIRHWTARHP